MDTGPNNTLVRTLTTLRFVRAAQLPVIRIERPWNDPGGDTIRIIGRILASVILLITSVESFAHGGIGVAGEMGDLFFSSLFIWLGAITYIGTSLYIITRIKWLMLLSPVLPFAPMASLYIVAFIASQLISFNSTRKEEQILFLVSVVIHLLIFLTLYITSRNRQTKQVILVVATPLVLLAYTYYQLFVLE